jgi:hypothetical protein
MSPLPRRWSLRIKGCSFSPEYPDNLYRVQAALVTMEAPTPIRANLEREPDNPHDPNAIAVSISGVGAIGHVPAWQASRLAPELDAGVVWSATVDNVLAHPDHPLNPAITVTFEREAVVHG